MSEFWKRVASAEWLADVGLPLLVALAGLIVAVRLVGEQIATDRKFRDGDRIRQQLKVVSETFRMAGVNLRQDATADYWQSSSWPDAQQLTDEIRRSIPFQRREVREEETAVAAAVASIWRAIAQSREMDAHIHAEAMRGAMAPLSHRLEAVAQRIELWNGLDVQPSALEESRRSIRDEKTMFLSEYLNRARQFKA